MDIQRSFPVAFAPYFLSYLQRMQPSTYGVRAFAPVCSANGYHNPVYPLQDINWPFPQTLVQEYIDPSQPRIRVPPFINNSCAHEPFQRGDSTRTVVVRPNTAEPFNSPY